MKHNWKSLGSSADAVVKRAARNKKVGTYLGEEPEEGYMRDPLNGNIKKLSECTVATLNRYIKSLNAMYKAVNISNTQVREKLAKKKQECQAELDKRVREQK